MNPTCLGKILYSLENMVANIYQNVVMKLGTDIVELAEPAHGLAEISEVALLNPVNDIGHFLHSIVALEVLNLFDE